MTSSADPGGTRLTCEQALDLMADYLESALTPEGLAALEAHLAGCDPCVAYLRTYRRTKELTAQMERVDMPEEMRARLRQFLVERLAADGRRDP